MKIYFSNDDFLQSLLSNGQISITPKSCPLCGRTFDDFLSTGKFGCGKCYDTFEDGIGEVCKKLHNAERHIKTDDRQTKIMSIKELLKEAIIRENYEDAAKYRDMIKQEEGDAGGNLA